MAEPAIALLTPPLPRYRSDAVTALKIAKIEIVSPSRAKEASAVLITPVDERWRPFAISWSGYLKHRPEVGGYWLLFDNGGVACCPAEMFEGAFTRI